MSTLAEACGCASSNQKYQPSNEEFKRLVLDALCKLTATNGSGGVTPTETHLDVNDVGTQEILAADTTRQGGYITNISDETIWISVDNPAVINECVPLLPYSSYPLTIDGKPIVSALYGIHGAAGLSKRIVIVTI